MASAPTVAAGGPRPESRALRGTLKIYLGAAPGVGKTSAMLSEGRRLHDHGVDVVVAYAEAHDRPGIMTQLAELEVVPVERVSRGSATFEELGLDAVLARSRELSG